MSLRVCVCPYVCVHVCVSVCPCGMYMCVCAHVVQEFEPPIPLDAPLHNGQALGLGTAEIKQDL